MTPTSLPTSTEVLVIGAGQSGIATSEHLTTAGIDHLVLERDRIAEKWRTGRWDSLSANGPAWHDRFPGLTFDAPTASGAASRSTSRTTPRSTTPRCTPVWRLSSW